MRTPSSSPTGLFTAAQLALALSCSKRNVQLALAGIAPGGSVFVRGQMAEAWRLESLPVRLAARLAQVAQRKGYNGIAHLLSDPPVRWQPSAPLNRLAPHFIADAERLRRALRFAIAERNNLHEPETRRRAFAEFRREWGAGEKQFGRLLQRTIDRDAGLENFDDLALYLHENAAPAPTPTGPMGSTDSDRRVLNQIDAIKDRQRPTIAELDLLWCVVCEEIHARMEAGEKEKKARLGITRLLIASGTRLARNEKGVLGAVRRKFERWIAGGMTLAAVSDQRTGRSGNFSAPAMSDEDRLRLIGHARLNCGGRVSQAYREQYAAGAFSSEHYLRFTDQPASKSYVPRAVRGAVQGDVRRLGPIHHGPREHAQRGAYNTRDWSQVAAGDWFQSDDLTPPIYFWAHTPRGVEIMRGQFLPMVDERTTYILGFVLIPEANYNSLSIRSLITTACMEHGLPRLGFSFEHGIWQRSKILTGSKNVPDLEVADRGLRSLGLKFRHAELPRGKVIERTLGQLQDRMEGWTGYCGRDERRDRFERFERQRLDVQAGRIAADAAFLSMDEVVAQYEQLCAAYNEEPQQGRKLDGLSPRQGWETLQGSPRIRFDERCAYLLAHDCRKLRVGRNGITLSIGKNRFTYHDGETGARVGEDVLAWFNPQCPDILPCTSLDQREVFAVRRAHDLPAVGASDEQLAEETAKIAAHNAYATDLYRAVKNILPPSAFRQNVLDRKTARVGAQIGGARSAVEADRRRQTRLATDREREARDASRELETLRREIQGESLTPSRHHTPTP